MEQVNAKLLVKEYVNFTYYFSDHFLIKIGEVWLDLFKENILYPPSLSYKKRSNWSLCSMISFVQNNSF